MQVKGRNFAINEEIRDKEVRVILADGEQLGVMSSKDAYLYAKTKGLDLVKIAPQAKPPVCKIVDFGKFRYEMERKEKEMRKNQKIVEVKEIKLSPNIGTNDIQTKLNHGRKFLLQGNKVKVTLRFRGREMAHMQQSRSVLDDFVASLSDIGKAEKKPQMEGKQLTVILCPVKNDKI